MDVCRQWWFWEQENLHDQPNWLWLDNWWKICYKKKLHGNKAIARLVMSGLSGLAGWGMALHALLHTEIYPIVGVFLIQIWWFIINHICSIHVLLLIYFSVTHWGRVTHICIGKLTISGSDNGLSSWSPPSHYQNQCWDIVNWNIKNKLQWNLKQNSDNCIQENAFENVVWKMAAILSRSQCVN